MMQLVCPWCGPRAEREFRCGGQTAISRPTLAPETTDDIWAEYLFFRDNPRGPLAERWVHAFGCGRWFNLLRSTETHALGPAWPMNGRAPQPDASDGVEG
jgi:sarcosine oxidase subunit delta